MEEVEEVFAVGHTFSAWKIGKDVGRRNPAELAGHMPKKESSLHSSQDEKAGATHME